MEQPTHPGGLTLSCPVPLQEHPKVMLAHGGGGKLMHDLISRMILPAFDNADLRRQHDSAVLRVGSAKIAFTTDSYVVRPMFFPGGNVGTLAVHGTINDLAMAGARPLYLSAGLILEEGVAMDDLAAILRSMREAADLCGVSIVTGDTKVVDKGKGDGVFINTAGIGVIEHELEIHPSKVAPGDAILVNGDLGRHGMAVMAVREGLEFESSIESDSAPVADIVQALLSAGIPVHCLRDITRGGLTSVLNEISSASGKILQIDERAVPVREDVRAACEILGFDPLQVACEGRFAAFVPADSAPAALEIIAEFAHGKGAANIGHVTAQNGSRVLLKSVIGATRILDMLSGEQLPRIC